MQGSSGFSIEVWGLKLDQRVGRRVLGGHLAFAALMIDIGGRLACDATDAGQSRASLKQGKGASGPEADSHCHDPLASRIEAYA